MNTYTKSNKFFVGLMALCFSCMISSQLFSMEAGEAGANGADAKTAIVPAAHTSAGSEGLARLKAMGETQLEQSRSDYQRAQARLLAAQAQLAEKRAEEVEKKADEKKDEKKESFVTGVAKETGSTIKEFAKPVIAQILAGLVIYWAMKTTFQAGANVLLGRFSPYHVTNTPTHVAQFYATAPRLADESWVGYKMRTWGW